MIVIFLLRSHGGLYRGGSSLIYTKGVTEDMIMGSVKVAKQGSLRPTPSRSSDIILKTICRNVSIRFKKSLSNGDDICSSCMHDRRSIKKTAVSVVYDSNEVAADLMWLMVFHKNRCRINVDPDFSGYQSTGSQDVKTSATSHSSCTAERVIGNRIGRRRPEYVTSRGSERRRSVSHGQYVKPFGKVAMSNYTQIIGSAQHDLNDINSILITLRENGKQGVIPTMYKEYDPTISSQPDSTVDRLAWRLGLVQSRRPQHAS